MKLNELYKLIFCILIWQQVLCSVCFAGARYNYFKKEHLSPKLSISNNSLQKSIEAYSKAKVENAFFTTVKNINDIGQNNLERDMSPAEILVALAMVFEGKSLKDVNIYFDNKNYLLEEREIKRKYKQVKRLIRTMSEFFFLKNKHVFNDPVKDLNEREQIEFLKKINKTMSDVINRFNEEPKRKQENHYTYELSDKSMVLELLGPIGIMQSNVLDQSQLLFSAI